ncbi:FtsW/RodA/SpoVE family cell cycle protein [bacterium]
MHRIVCYIDWKLITAVTLTVVFGLVFVYSALYNMPIASILLKKQIIGIIIGFIIMALFSVVDYNIYYKTSVYIYISAIVMLILVLFIGKTVRGANSWFDFGLFSFQPAEFARIAVILVLAMYLDKKYRFIKKFSYIVVSFLLAGVMIALILLQPDFGSMLVFIPIVFGMLYVSGVSFVRLTGFLLYGGLSIGIPLYATYVRMTAPSKQVFSHPVLLITGVCVLIYAVYYSLNKFRFRMPFLWLFVLYVILNSNMDNIIK